MAHADRRPRRGGAACCSAVDFIRVGLWLSGSCKTSILCGAPMLGETPAGSVASAFECFNGVARQNPLLWTEFFCACRVAAAAGANDPSF